MGYVGMVCRGAPCSIHCSVYLIMSQSINLIDLIYVGGFNSVRFDMKVLGSLQKTMSWFTPVLVHTVIMIPALPLVSTELSLVMVCSLVNTQSRVARKRVRSRRWDFSFIWQRNKYYLSIDLILFWLKKLQIFAQYAEFPFFFSCFTLLSTFFKKKKDGGPPAAQYNYYNLC